MYSSSSDNVEEDAWLMKIELKREEPVEAVKGDESKEATVDQPPVFEQALSAEEEEEDIIKPYYDHLTPIDIEAFLPLKWFVYKISITPVKIFCVKSISSTSGASSVDWRIS